LYSRPVVKNVGGLNFNGDNFTVDSEHFGKALDRLTEMIVLGRAHIKIARGLGRSVADDPAIAHVSRTFWGMTISDPGNS
jgi:hypothetical protein